MKKIKVGEPGEAVRKRSHAKTWNRPSATSSYGKNTGGGVANKSTIRHLIVSSSAPTDHSHAVSILHAGADCCRAIIGCDSSSYALAVYCGAPVLEGKHFCPEHFVQFTQPARSVR